MRVCRSMWSRCAPGWSIFMASGGRGGRLRARAEEFLEPAPRGLETLDQANVAHVDAIELCQFGLVRAITRREIEVAPLAVAFDAQQRRVKKRIAHGEFSGGHFEHTLGAHKPWFVTKLKRPVVVLRQPAPGADGNLLQLPRRERVRLLLRREAFAL